MKQLLRNSKQHYYQSISMSTNDEQMSEDIELSSMFEEEIVETRPSSDQEEYYKNLSNSPDSIPSLFNAA